MIRVTVLIENEPTEGFYEEHGLSFWIEYKGKGILLDAGKSGKIIENAEKLKIDLTKCELAFLSHGHYDHGDGFEKIFQYNSRVRVYASRGVFGDYYSMREGTKRYIGLSAELKNGYRERFVIPKDLPIPPGCVEEGSNKVFGGQIAKGIWYLGHQAKDYSFFAKTAALYMLKEGKTVLDDFLHECTLVLEMSDEHSAKPELAVFSSCSHIGIQNVLREVGRYFPNHSVKAVFGGFHFLGREPGKCAYSKDEVQEIAREMMRLGTSHVYTGHCTGQEGYEWMKEILGERLHYLTTGKTVNLTIT